MSQAEYCIALLNKEHDKTTFSSGVDSLDRYLIKEASQYKRRGLAVTYVLTENDTTTVMGYYTLSSASVNLELLPPEIQKKLPRYPTVPATLLGRLAVDKKHQKKDLGELLLLDALRKSFELSEKIGSVAVIVDAENNKVISFYKKYGFIELIDCQSKLFLPMKTIGKLWGIGQQ
jgi:ribosomal protein S18 acetylase RimI-like enzyme